MKSARSLVITLLLLNGVAALYGGWSLISDPTGRELELPADWITRLPFDTYLIPGLILLSANGVLSVIAAVLTILRRPGYERFVILQGMVLMSWILIQVCIVRETAFLHFTMAAIGLSITVLGVILLVNTNNHAREDGFRSAA